jgi:hypothetical protein
MAMAKGGRGSGGSVSGAPNFIPGSGGPPGAAPVTVGGGSYIPGGGDQDAFSPEAARYVGPAAPTNADRQRLAMQMALAQAQTPERGFNSPHRWSGGQYGWGH